MPTIHKHEKSTQPAAASENAIFALIMSRRLQAIVDRLKILRKCRECNTNQALQDLNFSSATNILFTVHHLPTNHTLQGEFKDLVKRFVADRFKTETYHKYIFVFQHKQKIFYKDFIEENRKHLALVANQMKLKTRGSNKAAFKAVREPLTAPLTFIKRNKDSHHGKKDTYATSKSEIDELIIDAWGKVRDGNCDDTDALISRFFRKYKGYIFEGAEYILEDLTVDQFMQECTTAEGTAASLDRWLTSEYSLLPRSFFQIIASFLNKAEK